ncbi:6305_t:CDS:1 [Paraglomus brasilianum]|uniref:6305_t:CDS:1 n=1 Tax=Paraglomus brasilianum TaxID=144538 RepID=A0A9N8Z544_9GLOM|nr:6305_t:CDS:1 [Paraglomus brasilianum]
MTRQSFEEVERLGFWLVQREYWREAFLVCAGLWVCAGGDFGFVRVEILGCAGGDFGMCGRRLWDARAETLGCVGGDFGMCGRRLWDVWAETLGCAGILAA